MKCADIIRSLADVIETMVTTEVDSELQRREEEAPAKNPVYVYMPNTHLQNQMPDKPAQSPDTLFVPPLQQKLELLKRAVNVDNVYDHTAEIEASAQAQEIPAEPQDEDELVKLRRFAGIVDPAIIQKLVNDEPLED